MNEALLTPIITKEIGNRIRGIRLYFLVLTQSELAEKLGISQQNLARLENGKTKKTGVSIETFRSVFKGHFNFVFYGMNNDRYYSSRIEKDDTGKQCVRHFWNLSSKFQNRLNKHLKMGGCVKDSQNES